MIFNFRTCTKSAATKLYLILLSSFNLIYNLVPKKI